MSQSRKPETDRKVHLRAVLNTLGTCKLLARNSQNPDDSRIIPALESQLLHADTLIQEIFDRIKPSLAKSDQAIADILKQEYAPIVAIFENCAAIFLDYANHIEKRNAAVRETSRPFLKTSYVDPLADRLKTAANDLLKLSKLIHASAKKSEDGWFNNNLYTLCHALGGQYVRFSQVDLPTMGGHENNREFTKSAGNCGGIIVEWARQSVDVGTPKYPVSCTIDVLQEQADQFAIKTKEFHSVAEVTTNDTNLCHLLEELKENYPHYCVLSSDHVKTRHAIGFRRQANFIEIADPNYGYFFFKDSKSAGAWLATLLHEYQTIDFPSYYLTVYQYNDIAAPFPTNQFPNLDALEKGVISKHTQPGYTRLLLQFFEQLTYVIYYAVQQKIPTIVETIADTIYYIYINLSSDDQATMRAYLQACLDEVNGIPVESSSLSLSGDFMMSMSHVSFMNELKSSAKNKFIIAGLIEKLTSHPSLDETLPASIKKSIDDYRVLDNQYKQSASNAMRSITALQDEIQQLAPNRDEETRKKLVQLHLQLVAEEKLYTRFTHLQKILNTRRIDGKLLASRAGLLRESYSNWHAKEDMKELEDKVASLYDMVEKVTDKFEYQLRKAKKQYDDLQARRPKRMVLETSDPAWIAVGLTSPIRQNVHLDEVNVHDLDEVLTCEAKIKTIQKYVDEAKQLREQVLLETQQQSFDDVFIQLGTLAPALKKDLANIEAVSQQNRAEKGATLFKLLSFKTRESVLEKLMPLAEKNDGSDASRIAKALLHMLIHMRELLIQCVNPMNADTTVLEMQLIDLLRVLMPEIKCISEITGDNLGFAITHQLAFANKSAALLAQAEKIAKQMVPFLSASKQIDLHYLMRELDVINHNFKEGRCAPGVNPAEFCIRNALIALGAVRGEESLHAIPLATLETLTDDTLQLGMMVRLGLSAEEVARFTVESQSVTPRSEPISAELPPVQAPSFFTRHPILKWSLIGLGAATLVAASIVGTGAIVLTAGLGIAAAIGLCAIAFSLAVAVCAIAEAFAGEKKQPRKVVEAEDRQPLLADAPAIASAPGKQVSGAINYSPAFFAGTGKVTVVPGSSQLSHSPASQPPRP